MRSVSADVSYTVVTGGNPFLIKKRSVDLEGMATVDHPLLSYVPCPSRFDGLLLA